MSLPLFAADSETFLISPGCQAPPLVCLQFCVDDSPAQIIHAKDPALKRWLEYALSNYCYSGHNAAFDLAVYAAAFPDLIPLIFDAYDADRIVCTIVRQKLIEIATGRFKALAKGGQYTLDGVAARLGLDLGLDKNDPWRLRYGTLYHKALELWDPAAKAYALKDATAQRAVHRAQGDYTTGRKIPLVDQFRQSRAAFWIRLMECRGIMVDPARVDQYIANTEAQLAEDREVAQAHGLVRKDGTRNTKAAMARMVQVCRTAEEVDLPITDTGADKLRAMLNLGEREMIPPGATWRLWESTLAESRQEIAAKQSAWAARNAASKRGLKPLDLGEPCGEYIKLDEDSCDLFGDEVLESYQRCGTAVTQIARAQRLKIAVQAKVPLQASFQTLIDTGRMACRQGDLKPGVTPTAYGFQLQNPAKDKKLKDGTIRKGTRECFVPRRGFVFCSTDYGSMELCGWAQICIWHVGFSRLAEVLNAGRDPHTELAASLARITIEEAYDLAEGRRGKAAEKEFKAKFRQAAKVANFGFPGGMGAAKMVLAARKQYGVILTLDEAKKLRATWREQWPESDDYFAYINWLLGDKATGSLTQDWSGRVRGGCYYAQLGNSGFQGLCADIFKAAGWGVTREMYARPSSPLFGSRLVNALHDEPFSELRIERAHEAAYRQAEIQVQVASEIAPDVKWTCKPAIMTRWYKDATDVHDSSGMLIPWEPEETKLAA